MLNTRILLFFLLLLSGSIYAQSLDLLEVSPRDTSLLIAKHYEDSIRRPPHVVHRGGRGDDRFPFPTLMVETGLGVGSCRWTNENKLNYSLSMSYHPLQFSTYDAHRPCYFGGAIRLALDGMIQPEQGLYEGKYCRTVLWETLLSVSLPMALTVRIGNADTHQLSVGIDPEFGWGIASPYTPGYTGLNWAGKLAVRTIIQYKYKRFFVGVRPCVYQNGYDAIKPLLVNVGWNLK